MLLAGTPYRDIAGQFQLSKSSLERHKEGHISESLLKSKDIEDTVNANSLTRQIEDIRVKIKSLLQKAEKANNLRDVHNFVGDTLKQIELEAKLQGQIKAQQININNQINLVESVEWQELRQRIITVLTAHPDALEELRNVLPVD